MRTAKPFVASIVATVIAIFVVMACLSFGVDEVTGGPSVNDLFPGIAQEP